MQRIASLFIILILVACTPALQDVGKDIVEPKFNGDHFVTTDNQKRPLRIWEAQGDLKGVIIGVHGFNDYGNFLNPHFPKLLNDAGYKLITYDQRGFGANENTGIFPTENAVTHDLRTLIKLVQNDAPQHKIFLFGESMGGAVVATTVTKYDDLDIDGVILSAPAVWGPSTWPWAQRLLLDVMFKIAPGLSLSGGGIVQPTDDMEIWKEWSRDPLVVKNARVDALWGISQIMETALQSAPQLKGPLLVMYGAKDEIIPAEATSKFANNLAPEHRFVFYPDGWHMLPRDLQYDRVFKDVLSFLENPKANLPSGFDQESKTRLQQSLD